ncbi:MAG: hypothetical protein HZB26_26480 [Candidatus Hydrogenedentes bacterium]|nr:hypothetical protein [Candidatus Hydrogenedentota bacterium]
MCLRTVLMVGTVAGACLLPAAAGYGEEMSFDKMRTMFRETPMDARRYVGPLFWLHGDESKERLEMYVGKVAEGGNGCFTTESRPHNDWLGEGWFRDLGICLDAAKKHDLDVWIFDEKWWPSGEVGGKVPPEYRNKKLVAQKREVLTPGAVEEPGCAGPNFIAVLAGKQIESGIEGSTLVDLADHVQNGVLHWAAPEGHWVLMRFTWETGDLVLIDGASKDAVDWYLKTVYQPHFARFGEEFGKRIRGFFYDEPETQGDWGTEVIPVLKERGVDWKKALVAWKFALAGDEQAAAKYQYQDALAEAWGRTLYGGVSKWCREHRVESIGHFLEHRKDYLNQSLCAGNVFQLMKYTDMGGIDAVFDQFVMGKRIARDAPCWETPKLGSSISHAYGKRDDLAMVEIFGARGQNLTYPEMKWWADHMFVSGVNFLIPHSFNPRAPFDSDCPPYFYNGGFEPRFPLYRVWADYASRLSTMLQGGRHVCPVAVLFLGGSAHVGKAVTPEELTDAIQDSLYDCDWIPYEVFEKDMQITSASLALREERYQALIVPPVEVIPYQTMVKVREFFDNGGVVLGYGFLPSKSATPGHTADEIAALRDAVWGNAQPGTAVCKTSAKGGRSFLLPESPTPELFQEVLQGAAGIPPVVETLEGKTDHWVHVLHRVKAGRDIFFITNQNHEGEPRHFRLRVTADGVPECWDPMRNEMAPLVFERKGKQVEFALTFEPLQSALVVFRPESAAGAQPVPGQRPAATLQVARDATPPQPPSRPDVKSDAAQSLEGASWIWHTESLQPPNAPPGTRYFRKTFSLPEGRSALKATFMGAADNEMVLFVNGKEAGNSNGWQTPITVDLTALLKAGTNTLEIVAKNGAEAPNPAGVLGQLRVTFAEGAPVVINTDTTWKTFAVAPDNWMADTFDDNAWTAARVMAPFGEGPWGRPADKALTLSPAVADPFYGHCDVPANIDLAKVRVYVEMDDPAPENAARITVNDQYAGGFIGRPCRVEVTSRLKSGTNTLRIEPFAPKSARLVCYAP